MSQKPPQYTISIAGFRPFACASAQRVLVAMEQAFPIPLPGMRRPLPVGCRRGGCGCCRVQVISGRYRTDRMSSAHVSEKDAAQGYVLACCLYPDGDLELQPAALVKTGPQAHVFQMVEKNSNGGSPWQ